VSGGHEDDERWADYDPESEYNDDRGGAAGPAITDSGTPGREDEREHRTPKGAQGTQPALTPAPTLSPQAAIARALPCAGWEECGPDPAWHASNCPARLRPALARELAPLLAGEAERAANCRELRAAADDFLTADSQLAALRTWGGEAGQRGKLEARWRAEKNRLLAALAATAFLGGEGEAGDDVVRTDEIRSRDYEAAGLVEPADG
jgi:hypothetical protein